MTVSEGRKSLFDVKMGGAATWIFLFCATSLFSGCAEASEPRVVCYYTNWSVYRPGTARFNPQNINPYLCTHLIYAFGGFTKDNTLKPFDKYQDIEKGGYAKFTGLKTYNSRLKTMLAIGGWNEGSTRFSPMVASRERRKEFVRNAIKFLRQNRFDGLDLDWEYPAFRDGGKPKDRDNYARLVRELREEFDKEAEKTGKPRLLLTMAVPAGIEYIQKGYDVHTLNRYLDWMNLLSYDYHSAFEPAVNHHAPLYPLEEPNEYSVDNELNIDYTIQYYLENGADRDKLVLGIPTYGRSYTLFNPDATDIGSPADGPGEQGDATREKGYLAYYEICESLQAKPKKKKSVDKEEDSDDESEEQEEQEEEEEDLPWTVMHPNPQAMGPVAFRGNQWVGYDDLDIVKKKAEYVADKGLGGIMFWSIDNDDFRGNCHGKPYPLIEAAKEAYINKLGITDNAITSEKQTSSSSRRRGRPTSSSSTSAPTPRSTPKRKTSSAELKSTTPSWSYSTPEPPTTPDPGSDFKCTDEGFFPHPRDCKKYFWCLDSGPSNLGIVAHQFTCPSGLYFNKGADSCDFARNVFCKKPSATTTSKPTTTSTSAPRTTTTTTRAPAVTTTRRPNKLTSKSSVYFRTTSSTTAVPVLDEDEVYEDDAIDDADATDVDSEDPKVIKELVDLIKKAGGVEQLERFLKLSDSSAPPAGTGTTTPLPISKKLYQRVLEQSRQGGKSTLLERYNSLSRDSKSGGQSGQNSRVGPQNAGLENVPEATSVRKERPQYTTINRSRPASVTTEETEEEDEQTEEETKESTFKSRTQEPSSAARPLPQYVNIRRARPSTEPPSNDEDDIASRNALFERNEASYLSTVSEFPPPQPSPASRHRDTPEYVTIRRRPTTAETTTSKYQTIQREKPVYEEPEEEVTSAQAPVSAALQYSTVQRTRAPPAATLDESLTSPSPTTVLAVQISSLLNSPVTDPSELAATEAALSDPEPTVLATPEPEFPTTVTEPPTTTTIKPSSAPTRRTILKRVRSTTTTTTATPAAPQVSSERNYNIIRRRRPNEISSDLDSDSTPRKIRSTTPDSLENPSEVLSDGETGLVSRGTRIGRIRPGTVVGDSVASAAAPISRGRFRPAISRDDLLSLTPIDDETPEAVPFERIAPRPERKFRPRNRPVTTPDSAPDAETSAATVEVRRPEFIPRGRSRFSVSTTTQAAITLPDVASTETVEQGKRLTFSRFTPRPFSKFSSNSPAQQEPLVSDTIPNESESNIASATPRTPVRLPFGRTRSPIVNPRTIVPQARIVSPLLRRPSSSTSPPDGEPVSEDELEEKNDDIHLSESTIEEKEHDNTEVEEPQEKPRRRIVIKKIKPNITPKEEEEQSSDAEPTSENDIIVSAVTPGDDSGRHRKIKVIRRRPTSVAPSVVQEHVTEPLSVESSSSAPVSNRIRKIIRKKIIHAPESTSTERNNESQKNDDKLSVELNYGDRASPVDILTNIELEVTKNVPLSESSSPLSITEPIVKETVTENTIQVSAITLETPISHISIAPTSSENPLKDDDENSDVKVEEDEETSFVDETVQLIEATTKLTTLPSSTTSKSKFGRPTYRPPKRIFTSSTEASATPSSRSYSRKYNAGTYTSPVTPDREVNARVVTRRPLFTSNPSGRRPFLARTTKKIEEDYDEEEPEEEIIEEPEAQLVLVPDNKLFTRGHSQKGEDDDLEESDDAEDDIPEKEEKVNKPTSRRPFFRPKSVNASTFRTSTTTTEVPKREYLSAQNRTSIHNSSRTIFNNSKKRTQNVPIGYNASSSIEEDVKQLKNEKQGEVIETTTSSDETEETTIDNDYLSVTSLSNLNASEKTDIMSTNTDLEPTTAEPMEVESKTDDYLDSTRETQETLSTETSTVSQHIFSETQTEPSLTTIESSRTTFTESNNEVQTEAESITIAPTVAPVVKTHLDKLFSVSRVVEVSSKLDKHKVNKKNESRLVETGKVMQEKKPTVDRIGEVSRFTLIKIVKDDIPIYLTKLGHAYPVDNPPNNPIRIDEGRNARTLMNFTDAGRENLVASESVNEAYRHINKLVNTIKENSAKTDEQLELLKEEHFEVHQNAEDRIDKSESFTPYPAQWQFIPAAYENDLTKEKHNKVAKSFEVVTPRTSKTDPSTIALEGLFKTENPLLITARKFPEGKSHGTGTNQPFVVYAAPRPIDDQANFVKLQVLKTEHSGRSVKTYVRGEELSGMSALEKATVKYPVSISILASETEINEKETQTTTELITEIEENFTPTNEQTTLILTTPVTTTIDDLNTTVAAETATEPDTTTAKAIVSSDVFAENAKKRPKLTFPRRSNFRTGNNTRTSASPLSTLARAPKKSNSTSSLKSNKSTGFNPNKSRFSASRSQNVPVDVRSERTKVVAGSSQRQNSTVQTVPSGGDSTRKLYLKPIRSSLVRPAFVPRRATTQATTQTRRNFPRRTTPRATELPPAASESNEATTQIPETSTKYRIRGNSKFDKKRTTVKVTEDRSKIAEKSEGGGESSRKPTEGFRAKKRPSLESETAASAQTSGAARRPTRTYQRRRYGGAANATTTPISSSTEKTSQTEATSRPFRVVSRRRSTPAPTSTSTPPAEAKKTNSDLAVLESIETKKSHNEDQATEPKRPHFKKTVKIQRRPLTSNKSETPSPLTTTTTTTTTTEEPKKRESKKYSATFKQNQLDEVIRQKSAESTARSEDSTEPLEELSVDTAIAIATHQLLGAPLPSTPSYEDEKYPSSKKHSSSSTKTYASTEAYTGYSNSKDYSNRGVTGSSNTPFFTSTIVSSVLPGSTVYSKYDLSSRSPVYSTSTRTNAYSNDNRGSSTPGYSGESSYIPSSRLLSQTKKYVSIPIEDFGYSTDSYTSGLGQEPVYFTRDYLMESPVTRRYETDYQYLTTSIPSTRKTKRPSTFRRISTTIAPSDDLVLPSATPQPRRVPQKVKVYDKLPKNDKKATYRPILNYDYYDDGDEKLLDMYPEKSKVLIHEKGTIECLDRGNFPHPASCRKFISCARMESGALVGWEYLCPQGLSYDPVGGICNWSAGLGCHDS